ncbi:M23 family metallopeptidase [Colwellia chukchiensis]|nr:M23 family metallopeptidase [Colwellia chukchiensis]
MKLNKLHWLSALTAFALISGFIVHLLVSADEVPASPAYQVSHLNEFEQPKLNSQVTAVTMKLAELQSQVLRLNALGDRLAEEASIPEQEFNFQQMPPSGGPMQSYNEKPKSLTELLTAIDALETSLQHEEKQLQLLESVTLGHHIENSRYLSGRPITKGWLSSYFGVRKDPFSGKPALHKGVDFAGSENADIIATASGVVSWAGERYGYGQLIEINHGGGYKTRYGHNKTIKVAVGDVVNKGQVIAKMGSTGRSTGPHVHYEILRNNVQIDPKKYVYRKAKN